MTIPDDVLAKVDVALKGVEESHRQLEASTNIAENTVSQLDRVRFSTEELAVQSQQAGFDDKVAVVNVAIDKSNEAQSRFIAVKQVLLNTKNVLNEAVAALQDAQSCILSLKGSITQTLPASRAVAPTISPPVPDGNSAVRSVKHSAGSWSDVTAAYPRNRSLPLRARVLRHVCDGEPRRADPRRKRGGHLFGTGRPKKTEFPREWDRERIAEVLIAVGDNPDRVRPDDTRGIWRARKRIDEVDVVVIVTPDGHIRAGWPLKGPRVRPNPPSQRSPKGKGDH